MPRRGGSLSGEIIQEARAQLYRLHWQVRSRVREFDLWQGLSLLRETERWPRARIDQLRDEKLRALVARMYRVSPHYRAMMDERGVRPADVTGLSDIGKLPVMTKAILREHAAALQATDLTDDKLEKGVTGGTTGVPMRVVRDYAGTTWMRASYWRGFGWGGLTLGQPWVQLFGGSLGHGARPLNRLKNWFSGKLFLPAFELDEHNVAEYVRAVQRSGARFLVGYTSACHQLALFVEKAGLSLRLDAVFPTAELLIEEHAERMARVFGAKVLPYYGCGEVQSLGYTCPDAIGTYHTCDEHAVIEVERPDGSAALQGEGAFLITDLDNQAMPLIRYRNGDAGLLGPPGCRCGRSLGRILRLDGRVNDVLITSGGVSISGAIGAHAFRLIGGVDAFQIVQQRPGQATIRIVRAPAYDPVQEEPKLRTIFGKHLGDGADIAIEYHSTLPKTAAGKARFVINEYLAAQAQKS
jgi:phenylacetate-CoA ligase